MFERFTDRARKVMQLTNQQAQRFNHQYVGSGHVLLGLLKGGAGSGVNTLERQGVDWKRIAENVEETLRASSENDALWECVQTPLAKGVIESAIEEARFLNHNYVGTEHLLIGLLHETEGMASQVLQDLKLDEVREEVLHLLGDGLEAAGDEDCDVDPPLDG